VKLVHLVGFITKKYVMMHGHMNVKKKRDSRLGWIHLAPKEVRWFVTVKISYVLFRAMDEI